METRRQKVARIRKELEEGTYRIDPYAIAGKIIERFLDRMPSPKGPKN